MRCAIRPALVVPSLVWAALACAGSAARGGAAGNASELWGEGGERWTPESRLPDFSFAGYRFGERPIPRVPAVANVKAFGAAGDGVTDDTQAFVKAVGSARKGAILVPEGRYVVTDVVTIDRGGVVLRGAGPDKTVLVIPKSLEQIYKAKAVDGFKSSWSFTGGFITVRGGARGRKLADVAQAAKRGETRLVLSKPAGLRPGDLVRLTMANAPGLGRHLHAGLADPGTATFKEKKRFVDTVARVVRAAGAEVELDRPLRTDVKPEWGAELSTFEPRVEEVGIEDLAFEFAGVPKRKHLLEEGFNAIHVRGAVNSWVRNVTFIDADIGVIMGGTRFCTVQNVTFKEAKRKGETGHHALWATGGAQECLFTDFRLETRYVHDLTVEGLAHGNVFSRGRGVAVNFDHHSNIPYENLLADIDVGDPRRMWSCGGRGDRGPHTGARTTLWNVRLSKGSFPKPPDWPQLNVIGLAGYAEAKTADGRWIEPLGARPPEPADLHEAQLARRVASLRRGRVRWW